VGDEIAEERDNTGALVKRFYRQGVQIETGASAGAYFYTRDHLESIRELVDNSGAVRARYSYDPYGRRTKVAGDVDADFGFAGMFWSAEASLHLTKFRTYDAGLGRWLSRDPLYHAESAQGPNLYTYVGDDPVNRTDPLGLQNVGPKAPPGGPNGPSGPLCRDVIREFDGVGNCILCAAGFFRDVNTIFMPGDSCDSCSVRARYKSCDPPTPPQPPNPSPPPCGSPLSMSSEGIPPCKPPPTCPQGSNAGS
jgi:RHS repeat-associated protein